MALRTFKKHELAALCPEVTLDGILGEGGNARVFAGRSHVHGAVAVKFMLNSDTKRYDRFRDEVLVVTTRLKGLRRVVPILESHLPERLKTTDVPWYVMPSACRLLNHLAGMTWHDRVQALHELAEGLAELHAQEVAHRDIKPDNLFELGGSLRFADFGIAAFPERAGVTDINEPMGPAHYMAPEMFSSANADPYKADVFSFGKTIWVLLTGQKYPFPGCYSPRGRIALSSFLDDERFVTEPLDALLEESTSLEPDQRPTAIDLALRLKEVLDVQGDFQRTNRLQWGAAEVEALGVPGLTRAEWQGVDDIAQVVTLLSRRHGLNHCFFPSGGGQTIDQASTCEGGSMLSLIVKYGGRVIVKPKRLTLERFPSRQDLSYAVLETEDVEPLGDQSRYRDDEREYLKQLNSFDYGVDDTAEEQSNFAHVGVTCERYFRGGLFVIAPTAGVFNRVDDYQGNANRAGREQLRTWFEEAIRNGKSPSESVWKTTRVVRLLPRANGANVSLTLQYIDDALLQHLIGIDDRLYEERFGSYQESLTGGDWRSDRLMEKIIRGERSENEEAARTVIATFTPAKRAEFLALVYLGRGSCDPEDFERAVASNLNTHYENHYLAEKLGNRYMRRALERFGLQAPDIEPVSMLPKTNAASGPEKASTSV